jgi:hypothetical protein
MSSVLVDVHHDDERAGRYAGSASSMCQVTINGAGPPVARLGERRERYLYPPQRRQ